MAFRVLLLALLVPVSVAAAEIAGVKIDDKTRVADSDLTLNGAGMRTRLFFQVYAIGLYLPQKGSTVAAVLAQPGPKRVAIHMLRDVGADAFTQALTEGIRENHSEAEAKALEPRIKELAAIMAEIKEARKGMTIALDWTGAGTQLVVQGKAAGKPIAGEDFYRALLRIWLGDKPVQDDLKKALLGG
jgi:Chalcone isomerase-like